MSEDADLVSRARAGDRRAFGQLVERHQGAALRLARRMVRNEETARELAQEALLEAYLALGQLRDAGKFAGWLMGVVRHTCLHHIRAQRGGAFSLTAALDERAGPSPDPEEVAVAREEERLLAAAVAALTPRDQELVQLFYFEGIGAKEIAARQGGTTTSINTRLHRARKRLAKTLQPTLAATRPSYGKPRREIMIEVQIADVIQRNGIAFVVLMEEGTYRFLSIQVGHWEGWGIAHGLLPLDQRYGDVTALGHTRPQQLDLVDALLQRARMEVEEVRIEVLKDSVLMGVVRVSQDGRAHEQEARPSDAIALALRTGAPICVAADLLKRAGQVVPEALRDAPERAFPGAKVLEKAILTWGHFDSLERIHEPFCAALGDVLAEAMGAAVETGIRYVDQTTYGETVDSLSAPCRAYTLNIEGMDGEGMIELEWAVVAGLLGLPEDGPRPLTAQEQGALAPVVERLARALEETWAPVLPVAVRDLAFYEDAAQIDLAARAAHVCLCAFEVGFGDGAGLVRLCYPNALFVDPVLPRLAPGWSR